MLDGDAAGEVHRRGRICSKRLSYVGFFGAPFLPKQERCELIDKLKFDILFDSILRLSSKTVKVDIFRKRG